MRFAPALVVLALVAPATLAGCSPVTREPERPPGREWAAPALFTSEEMALTAAREFYESAVRANEAIGNDPSEVQLHSTPEYFEYQVESYRALAERGQRLSGRSTVLEVRLQHFERDAVTIYACHDFSGVMLLDSTGRDVTPENRPDIATFQVKIVVSGSRLLVQSSELWSHGTRCF